MKKNTNPKAKTKAQVLGVGPDDRNIYTSDPDARGGKRSATNSRNAGLYVGYELHVFAEVRDIHPGDYVTTAKLGPDVPPMIVSAVLKPAGSHRAVSVVDHIIGLKRGRVPQLSEIIFDRGYSQLKPEDILFPLRRRDIEPVFDLTEDQRGSRVFKTADHLIDGSLFSRHAPSNERGIVEPSGFVAPLPRTPRFASVRVRDEHESAFNLRARWRFSRHSAPDERGSSRWICPFHAKRLRSRAFPESMGAARTRPFVFIDKKTKNDKCCDGAITVEAHEMPIWQRFPYGTTAWRMAYNRRNVVEGVNSSLQSQFTSMQKGYTNVRSLSKLTMMVAFTAAGHNVRTAAAYRRKQGAVVGKSRPRKTKAWGMDSSSAPANTSPAVDSPN